MAEYVSPEIEQDPAAIQQQIIDDLEAALPGLEVKPATVTYYLIAIFAFLWARLAEQSSQVFSTIFRYYGRKVVREPPQDAVSATTTVTFTAQDVDGPYDVPAGTEINLRGADGTPVPFRTLALATILNGSTTITPVTVAAAVPGASANGLSALVSVTQTFSWLESVTVLAPSAGGEDAEDDDAYVNRLADLLTLPRRTLARPENFEAFARNWPGVDRALAINNYRPSPPSSVAYGHVTVFPIDTAGAPLTTGEKNDLLAALQLVALVNLIVHVADPTFTDVDVVYEGVCRPGFNPADVQAAADAAVLAFLSPALWALPQEGDVRGWENRDTVYHQDISTVLNNVQGFERWTTLTINGVAADFALDVPAPLPSLASTVGGTVTAP